MAELSEKEDKLDKVGRARRLEHLTRQSGWSDVRAILHDLMVESLREATAPDKNPQERLLAIGGMRRLEDFAQAVTNVKGEGEVAYKEYVDRYAEIP